MNNLMNNSYILVDLDQIGENARTILSSLPKNTGLIPVLKDDAYGLGQERVGAFLADQPWVRMLAVSHVSEGAALRRAGVEKDILVMGGTLSFQLPTAVELGLTVAVGRLGLIPLLADLAGAGRPVKVHVKVETGLHRIGLMPGQELEELIGELRQAGSRIEITGAFSHFADLADQGRTRRQHENFLAGVQQLQAAGFAVPLRHISASESSEYQPQYDMDAVRIGRRLYMDHPTRPLGGIGETCSWRTFITNLRHLHAGDSVGYGGQFHLDRDALVATIGVGYGDGLNERLCQVHGPVLVHGRRCPLLECCMDQAFVDVTGLDCCPDDEVTLLGYDRAGNYLSSQELALLAGAREGCGLTSALSTRVARVYRQRGVEEPF